MRIAFIIKWIYKKEVSWRKSSAHFIVKLITRWNKKISLREFWFIERCNSKLWGENWYLKIEWTWR